MLIEFRVKNFRSIRDEQVLSMVAANRKEDVTTQLLPTGIEAIPSLIPSAVLYGANASGKSNLIKALNFMHQFIVHTPKFPPGQSLGYESFRLNGPHLPEPTEFEITFLMEGVRYQYGFSLHFGRVVEEWLLVYKTQKAQTWFTRHYDPQTEEETYHFGEHLKGMKQQRLLWQKSTRSDVPFLSMASTLNSEQLLPIFNWIADQLFIMGSQWSPSHPEILKRSKVLLSENSGGSVFIQRLMNAADNAVTRIQLIPMADMFSKQGSVDPVTGQFVEQTVEHERSMVEFIHKTEQGEFPLDLFMHESTGTQRLFALAGPLWDILQSGRVFVIDELNNSLHPLLVRELIALFHDPATNPRGAQLIFTTHDTSLLDTDLFRRDQIWFLEKNQDQATELYPLTDFHSRAQEPFQRRYLSGKYGGIPCLEGFEFLRDSDER